MNYLKKIVLLIDIPAKGLKKGDVATIVEHHPSKQSWDGYSLEVFNALGDTIDVITVSEIDIEPLKENEIFSVRPMEAA
jgi:hypothetical protein